MHIFNLKTKNLIKLWGFSSLGFLNLIDLVYAEVSIMNILLAHFILFFKGVDCT